MKRYYIAYGSNLNIAQMRKRCPGARVVGRAWIADYHLLYKGSKTGSYLTIEKMAGAKVPVAVWEVTAYDEAMLDRYEGCPIFYYKKELELDVKVVKNGKVSRLDCFVYIMHEDRAIGIPHHFYVETCMKGYSDFGFDEKYLKEALDYSWREMKWKIAN